MSVSDDAVFLDRKAMEGGWVIDEGEVPEGGQETDKDGGREVSGREKMSNEMIAAGVVTLINTMGWPCT